MNIKKRIIGHLTKCYSIAPLHYNDRDFFLVAAEKQDPCYLYDLDGNQVDKIWDGPGGVMSMVQIPRTNGEFLATFQFYSPNDSKEAKIVRILPNKDGTWASQVLAKLPHVHRFDLLESNGFVYLIACTLKSGHTCKDDWSSPGKVYAALLPEDLSGFSEEHPLEFTVLKENMLKNHGYCRCPENGQDTALISCEEGIFQFFPPAHPDEAWNIRPLLNTPASDAVLVDLDGDGKKELCVISPFHGDKISIYADDGSQYKKIYDYPETAEFSHAICCCTLCDQPAFVFGHRKGKRNLVAITYNKDTEAFQETLLDTDCGPANVYHYQHNEKDILISTNREIDEIAMYLITG